MQNKSKNFDVIVIGGGVAGLSTALQLGRRGVKTLVVDRGALGSGSTGRAAGLLGQLRGSIAATSMLMDGVKIVQDLEAQCQCEIFVQTGSLRIAETTERAGEIRDLVAMGKSIQFPIETLDAKQVAELLPYMKTDDLLDACYCPTDGHLQPAELTSAYIKAGRQAGVEYKTNCRVDSILNEKGKITGVQTEQGISHSPIVVNAAGPWSYLTAGSGDVILPTASIGHYYLTTRPDPEQTVDRKSPAVRDRHHRIYSRPESGGLIVGMYEAEPVEYDMERLPDDFDMSLMKVARDDFNAALLIHAAQQRFPWINERTPMTLTTGIMTFTPDGKPFCGKMDNLEGLFHCTGFSGHGIVQSPVVGVIMADLILDGSTKYDIEAMEADRYYELPGFQTRSEIKSKCAAMYGSYYGRVERPEILSDSE
ncbi:MAG TPA: FAD-binding oxidoreductase [Verrucomicrobiales bacterium]|nr:FAD-binding oxidoreductase [Verrucomicrobiales bacterium]